MKWAPTELLALAGRCSYARHLHLPLSSLSVYRGAAAAVFSAIPGFERAVAAPSPPVGSACLEAGGTKTLDDATIVAAEPGRANLRVDWRSTRDARLDKPLSPLTTPFRQISPNAANLISGINGVRAPAEQGRRVSQGHAALEHQHPCTLEWQPRAPDVRMRKALSLMSLSDKQVGRQRCSNRASSGAIVDCGSVM